MKEKTNKKKIVFTEKDKENIISKYKSGLSSQKIADKYGCSEITIRRFLRSNNITAKDNPHNIFIDDLSNEDKQYIINSYLNGIGANKLAKQYNCNEGAIRNFLNKNGITYKDAKHYHLKDFSEEVIKDIIDQYKSGVEIIDLSRKYDCNYKTIRKLIPQDILQQYKIYVHSN
jgi:transposase-like protein